MINEPIAVIGLSCRFPKSKNVQGFYKLVSHGVDAITHSPRHLENSDILILGGFLENIEQFSADFFSISPQEAATIDPQQRLLLEIAWDCLEDAGQVPKNLAGSSTGVFVGITGSGYSELMRDQGIENFNVTTGNQRAMAANRISYFFDFCGPSMSVDTACSSALVAVDRACRSLWSGESTLALAGGVNLILIENKSTRLVQADLIAKDHRCKVFDACADGYVRSEGVGMVVLKPLSQAQADGDRVYAVIKASAVNHNGRSNGLTAPNLQAQVNLLQQAYNQAQIDRATIDYIETHATGTPIGDALELKAIGKVLGRSADRPCRVGSVKTNMGHTEAASGIAGLIKVILSLHHRQFFPNLHFQQPNPAIAFENLGLQVQQQLEILPPTEQPRRMGVSAFGFGGTNAHVLLESAPKPPEVTRVKLPFHIFTLSAQTETALQTLVKRYLELLSENPEIDLGDLCYSANVRRSRFQYRLFTIAPSIEQLHNKLETFIQVGNTSEILSQKVSKRQRKINTWIIIQEITMITQPSKIGLMAQDNPLPWHQTLTKLGRLWLESHNIDWSLIYSADYYQFISLPTYPFERKSYWFNSIPYTSETSETKSLSSPQLTDNPIAINSEDSTVVKLQKIWQNLLNKKVIQDNENFFELGGNSLLAVTLCLEIEKTFGNPISPITIFEFPTIKQLSQFLEQRSSVNSSSLTIIQSQENEPPLISVNSITQMQSLASALGVKCHFANLNIFKFSAEKITTILQLETKQQIPAIAAIMVRDILNSSLKSPYKFIAFCGDTHLTIEIIRQLQELKKDVSFVILIDGILRYPKFKISDRYKIMLSLGGNYLYQKSKDLLKANPLKNIFSSLFQKPIHPPSQHEIFYNAYLSARSQYLPKPYLTLTYLLLSTEWKYADCTKIRKVAGENLEIREVLGMHNHLFDSPYVNYLAEETRKIQKANSRKL